MGRRLRLFGCLVAAAVITEEFEIGPWLAAPLTALALRFGLQLDARRWLRRGLTALVVALALVAGMRMLAGIPYVTVSAFSPDGHALAELVETDFLIDRHFEVRLTTWWLGALPRRRILFRSPDEGPRGGERLLWSRDSRYVLLVGPNLFAVPDACLASGDKLYLLVDTPTGLIRANAVQTRHARFSLEDIRGRDFVVPLAPGTHEQHQPHRCSVSS